MIYDELAKYYDALVKDDEATKAWVAYTNRYIKKGKLLELACGSGEISHALQEEGFDILATDISEGMLNKAKQKYPSLKTQALDMRNFNTEIQYDGVICYCDSINYLNDLDEFKKAVANVYQCLNSNGVFLFDMHTQDRLQEFQEEFIEEGYIEDVPYQWTISSDLDDKTVVQHFAFYTKDGLLQEQHIQSVFACDDIINILKETGFSEFEIKTDFDKEGEVPGEKLFIKCRKGGVQ